MKYTAQFSVTLTHTLVPPPGLGEDCSHNELFTQTHRSNTAAGKNTILTTCCCCCYCKSLYGNIASVMLWGYHRWPTHGQPSSMTPLTRVNNALLIIMRTVFMLLNTFVTS